VFNFGYVFNSDFHGRGYATEACRVVLKRAFEQYQADRVVTATAAVNQPSRHLLEKLGFKKTGERTESFRSGEDGKPVEFTGYSYELTRKEI
jgi:RimJ/RimL family protein N-acetyltransferase